MEAQHFNFMQGTKQGKCGGVSVDISCKDGREGKGVWDAVMWEMWPHHGKNINLFNKLSMHRILSSSFLQIRGILEYLEYRPFNTGKAEGLSVISYTSQIKHHYCPRTLVRLITILTWIVKGGDMEHGTCE